MVELSGMASSGPELVDMAREFRPDLIVSDNRMPNRDDGVRAINKIMQFLPECRCILWSADDPNDLPVFPGVFVSKGASIIALRDAILSQLVQ